LHELHTQLRDLLPEPVACDINTIGAHLHPSVARYCKDSWLHIPFRQLVQPVVTSRASVLQVLAYLMEIGCVFHSVLIGVGVGVLVDDRTQVIALVIALSFHQFLEGISLGSVVNVAGFAKLKGLSMVLLYSLTTPIGIAIGIGIASTYDPSSVTAIAVQGVLSAVAGGMLLYIALIQLIGEEFSRQELLERNGLKFAMLISLTVGAASMCMLAIWA
jgi:zinc transporter 1/2/3